MLCMAGLRIGMGARSVLWACSVMGMRIGLRWLVVLLVLWVRCGVLGMRGLRRRGGRGVGGTLRVFL